MQCRELVRILHRQGLPGFKVIDRLMFRAVVLEDTPHVFHPRDHEKEKHECGNAQNPVDQVEEKSALEPELALQEISEKQRKRDKQRNVDAEGEDDIPGN